MPRMHYYVTQIIGNSFQCAFIIVLAQFLNSFFRFGVWREKKKLKKKPTSLDYDYIGRPENYSSAIIIFIYQV